MNETLEDIIEAQGWSDATVLGVLIDFIDNHADKRALIEFARNVAAEENAAAEEMWS